MLQRLVSITNSHWDSDGRTHYHTPVTLARMDADMTLIDENPALPNDETSTADKMTEAALPIIVPRPMSARPSSSDVKSRTPSLPTRDPATEAARKVSHFMRTRVFFVVCLNELPRLVVLTSSQLPWRQIQALVEILPRFHSPRSATRTKWMGYCELFDRI